MPCFCPTHSSPLLCLSATLPRLFLLPLSLETLQTLAYHMSSGGGGGGDCRLGKREQCPWPATTRGAGITPQQKKRFGHFWPR